MAVSVFYTLRRQQWIPRSIEEVFAFFSNAANLAAITPPWLGFHMLTPGDVRMTAGTELRYRLKWHGVPVSWTTVIRQWNPPVGFSDAQMAGPYKLWHHTHRFESWQDGTRMTDVVRYRLPMGWMGRAVHAVKVRRDLEAIFDYRRDRIGALFPSPTRTEAR
jgi:ligand-binding SRPBCC domain-containing protein